MTGTLARMDEETGIISADDIGGQRCAEFRPDLMSIKNTRPIAGKCFQLPGQALTEKMSA
ncbi:hypothetical protein [Xenorhabdus cabanillasii]|uniref:hypothetical protein n=1 Tax=Xenorhabdus cabanillasii TaxID=351673 RepID=UPI0004BC2E30|nr:hypothetical protein [Xenorhabdus cabanillasii]